MSSHPNGGMPARGAVVRWSWRLFRRDWRQHLLIVILLTASVAAAVGFTSAAYNVAPASGNAQFGDATHFFRFEDNDAASLQAKLDAGLEWFGSIDAIGHNEVPVQGTEQSVDYRSQDPDGAFGGPMLALRTGRYPVEENEAAVTEEIAELAGTSIGSTIALDGDDRTVVGIVENPNDLDDNFVLLAPSAIARSESVSMLVSANEERVLSFRPPSANGRTVSARGDMSEDVMAAVLVLVVSTLALFLVGLIAAASFTVIAHRRLPQLGMMSAIGATEKHLRLSMLASGAVTGSLAAVVGGAIGIMGWVFVAPRMESAAGYRIDPYNLPLVVVTATMLLAIVAATASAWWPGRTVSRIPTVLALSGRPPRPAALHRSAALAVAFLTVGIICLAIGGRAKNGVTLTELVIICVGILGVVGGVLLVSPLAVRALASVAGRAPIAERLALRDLGRYRARSASALAAVALALGLPVVIVATTAAAENQLGVGNLPTDQIVVQQAGLDGPFLPDSAAIASLQAGVDAIADELDDATVLRLDGAANPNARPDPNVDAVPGISVARRHGDGWADLGLIFVATPELLEHYGLPPDAADDAGILTSFALPLDVMDLGDAPPPRRETAAEPREASRPAEPLEAPGVLPDTYTALPGALISTSELAARGWTARPSGRWLITNADALSPAELEAARTIAVQYGLSIQSRDESSTLANVRLGAVAVGMILALGILAMTVGLIRAESVGELRTLTATGATGSIRRRITAATASGLAGLGALLGATGAYVALVAAQIKDLSPLPIAELVVIVIGTPLAAAAVGWVFAGREPEALGRRPIG